LRKTEHHGARRIEARAALAQIERRHAEFERLPLAQGGGRAMLIDQLLSNQILVKAGMLSAGLRGRLTKVTKFTARCDFAMADEFGSSIDNLNKALPFARLPYNECWLEVAQEDRRSFAEAGPIEEGDSKIARVGYLLTQLDHEGSWSAQLFWSFPETEAFAGVALPPSQHPSKLVFDAGEARASGDIKKSIGFVDNGDQACNPMFGMFKANMGLSDWVGEPDYIVATLALLNSRNASEIVPVDMAKLNKRRKLVGKPLLFDYHELCIPQRYKQRNVPSAGEDPVQLRAHFVRGHFKVRKTGVFFWNAYQRGNPSLGFVHKDYVLDRLMQDARQ
jgi:hypothetical protein